MDQLLGESICRRFRSHSFYTCLPLKSHVRALTPKVLEALLASDALQVTIKNEVYTLLGCWLYQSPHAGPHAGSHRVTATDCLPLFCRLVKFVRLPHLATDYLASVVSACPLATESGLLLFMLRLCLANPKALEQGTNPVPLDRGRGSPWCKSMTTFELADAVTLDPGDSLCKYVGLVDGYPVQLQIRRSDEDTNPTSFGIFVFVLVPEWMTRRWEGGPRRTLGRFYWVRLHVCLMRDIARATPDFLLANAGKTLPMKAALTSPVAEWKWRLGQGC